MKEFIFFFYFLGACPYDISKAWHIDMPNLYTSDMSYLVWFCVTCFHFVRNAEIQRKTEMDKERSSICRFTLQGSQRLRLDQPEAGSLGFQSSLPHEWQGFKYVSPHVLTPGMCIKKKLSGNNGARLKQITPGWNVYLPTTSTNAHLKIIIPITVENQNYNPTLEVSLFYQHNWYLFSPLPYAKPYATCCWCIWK